MHDLDDIKVVCLRVPFSRFTHPTTTKRNAPLPQLCLDDRDFTPDLQLAEIWLGMDEGETVPVLRTAFRAVTQLVAQSIAPTQNCNTWTRQAELELQAAVERFAHLVYAPKIGAVSHSMAPVNPASAPVLSVVSSQELIDDGSRSAIDAVARHIEERLAPASCLAKLLSASVRVTPAKRRASEPPRPADVASGSQTAAQEAIPIDSASVGTVDVQPLVVAAAPPPTPSVENRVKRGCVHPSVSLSPVRAPSVSSETPAVVPPPSPPARCPSPVQAEVTQFEDGCGIVRRRVQYADGGAHLRDIVPASIEPHQRYAPALVVCLALTRALAEPCISRHARTRSCRGICAGGLPCRTLTARRSVCSAC
jgi:hypothetical protein